MRLREFEEIAWNGRVRVVADAGDLRPVFGDRVPADDMAEETVYEGYGLQLDHGPYWSYGQADNGGALRDWDVSRVRPCVDTGAASDPCEPWRECAVLEVVVEPGAYARATAGAVGPEAYLRCCTDR